MRPKRIYCDQFAILYYPNFEFYDFSNQCLIKNRAFHETNTIL